MGGKRGKKQNSKESPPKPASIDNKTTKENAPCVSVSEESLERELIWCMEQLKFGIENNRSKGKEKQVQDGVKLYNVLLNPQAPLVKKRQVMRTQFGDYRKKMASEDKKQESSGKKEAVIQNAVHAELRKARFLRLAARKKAKRKRWRDRKKQSGEDEESTAKRSYDVSSDQIKSALNAEEDGAHFKFDFPATTESTASTTSPVSPGDERKSSSECNSDESRTSFEGGITSKNKQNKTEVSGELTSNSGERDKLEHEAVTSSTKIDTVKKCTGASEQFFFNFPDPT